MGEGIDEGVLTVSLNCGARGAVGGRLGGHHWQLKLGRGVLVIQTFVGENWRM